MPVTLTAPLYLFFGSVAACAVFGLWGFYTYKSAGLSAYVAVRFLLAALTGPIWTWQLATSTIELDKTTISWTTGFPWATEQHTVNLEGVLSVAAIEVGAGRGRGEAWVFAYPDGKVREIRLTDIWRENREEIANHFSKMGIILPR
jgi:hypothetical protein